MKKKKPRKERGFLIYFYRCPYCSEMFSEFDIDEHIKICFKQYRLQVKKTYSERAKRNFREGKILKHIKRKTEDDCIE